MRDSAIDIRPAADPAEPTDLSAALTQAYLHGDGAAVERIMTLIKANQTREPVDR